MYPGSIAERTEFQAQLYLRRKDEGGRHTPIFDQYRPQFVFGASEVTGVISLPSDAPVLVPGESTWVTVRLTEPAAVEVGQEFTIREGHRTVGTGSITKILA